MNADTETGNSDKLNESREGVRRVSLVVGKRERGDGGGLGCGKRVGKI